MKPSYTKGALVASVLVALATLTQAQIPTNGLVLYLQADNSVQTTGGGSAANNDPVVTWRDESAAANDVSTNGFAGTTTPTFKTGAVNGQPAVGFGYPNLRDTDRLQATTPLLTGSTDFSIFAVVRMQSPYTTGARFIGGNYGFGNNGLEFDILNGKVALYDVGLSLTGTSTLAGNQWYLLEATKSGSTYTLRVNDNVETVATQPGYSIPGALNWTVGNGPNYSTEPFYGDIAAQIVYTSALSAQDHAALVTYLFGRYANAIPEPTTISLALAAIAGGCVVRRRRA